MFKRTIAVLVAALALSLAPAVADSASATSSKRCHGVHETRALRHHSKNPKVKHRAVSRRADLFVHVCRKETAGVHGIYWVRPNAFAGQYDVDGYLRRPWLWSLFSGGDLTNAVFHLTIWNPDTGYHHRASLSIHWATDGNNAGAKGLAHMPRCYMPWIDTSGRVPNGHRSHCKWKASLEGVRLGPEPNSHWNIGRGYIL